MENPNQQLQKSSDTPQGLIFDSDLPILEQKEKKPEIARSLLAKWIECDRILLKSPEVAGREESTEELRMVEKIMSKHQDFTPRDFANAIRKAVDMRVREVAANGGFPRSYYPDIEEACLEIGREKIKNKPEPLVLEKNVGGNPFWGEPTAALDREWPKIVDQTMKMRAMLQEPHYRDRFWHSSNADAKASAINMLREMTRRLQASPNWNLEAATAHEVSVFKHEYCLSFPQWGNIVAEIKTIRQPTVLEAVHNRTVNEIRKARLVSADAVPSIDSMPDPTDCIFCGIFDLYLNHWQELQQFTTAIVVE